MENAFASKSVKSVVKQLTAEWRFKLGLTFFLVLAVGIPYYALQYWQLFPQKIVPTLPVDQWITFNPDFVWLYLSLYLFMPIAPLLMTDRRRLRRYAGGMMFASLIANVFFLLSPTVCTRPSPDASLLYQLLVTVDRPCHAFPSLHAAFAVFSALCAHIELRLAGWCRLLIWTWAILILYAALATKQHVFIDIVAGTLLGLSAFVIAFAFTKTPTRETYEMEHSTRIRAGDPIVLPAAPNRMRSGGGGA